MREANPTDRKAITIHITNLSVADAQFLTQVIALFADPNLSGLAGMLRGGDKHHLRYGKGGTARVCADLIDQ